jgi:hypothetical protein
MDEGDQVTRGERGPKGDHGQGGDVGLTGEVGERGDKGQKGERGDTGAQGESTLWSRNVSVSFLVMTVVFFGILCGLSYSIVQNRDAIERTCVAANEGRAINNRDRLTLLRGARRAADNVRKERDPHLRELLRQGMVSARAEVRARPYLEPLPGCDTPVPFPPRTLEP